VGRAGRAGA
jgi:hypothetical protein